ncbi:hypothetical protein K502DRAFT_368369 [Neoconidiobolus thromboides FSU 785]|nr:hypothetical protein K502DRAFT_368369 [Neoconidiobolus thromboides FSU 785]
MTKGNGIFEFDYNSRVNKYTTEQVIDHLKRVDFIKADYEANLLPASFETLKGTEEPCGPSDLHTTRRINTIRCRLMNQNRCKHESVVAIDNIHYFAIMVLLVQRRSLVDLGCRSISDFQLVPIHNDILNDNKYLEAILTDNTKL